MRRLSPGNDLKYFLLDIIKSIELPEKFVYAIIDRDGNLLFLTTFTIIWKASAFLVESVLEIYEKAALTPAYIKD